MYKIEIITKTFNFTSIVSAKENKISYIGENKVQEFLLKTNEHPNLTNNIETHLIGHLQSNKANKAIDLFDVIQTVDSLKIANKINVRDKYERNVFCK